MKSWLQDNGRNFFSTHNEEKYVAVVEKFIRTFKNRIYGYMTSLSKNVYIDQLDDTVNKYNSTYHRTIKIKPIGVTSSTCIEFKVANNYKILNLKLLIL